jgi:S1-C subfamily serine protease
MRHPLIDRLVVALVVVAFAFTGVAVAGHGKCTKSPQDCAAYMKEKYQTQGWSGLEKDHNEDGTLTVRSVVPNGPADRAGIKPGDVLVSLNGVTLSKENEARIREMKAAGFKIGDTMSYSVKRGQESMTVKMALERIPEAVLAGMIAKHTKEEHTVAKN